MTGTQKEVTYSEKYCRTVVLKYRQVCALVWITILGLTGIVVVGGYFDVQQYTADDWTIAESESSKNKDAFDDAIERSDFKTKDSVFTVPTRSELAFFTSFNFIYEWADSSRKDDIFTPKNVQIFCEMSRVMTASANYPLFCQTQSGADGPNTTCDDSLTDLTTFFYPSPEEKINCPLLSNANVTSRRANVVSAISFLGPYFFDKSLENSGAFSNPSPRTRSNIVLAGPLGKDSTEGKEEFSRTLETDSDDQWNYYKEFFVEVEKEYQDVLGIESVPFRSGYSDGAVKIGDLAIRYYTFALDQVEIDRLIITDMALAAGSVLFVFTCMIIHVRSAIIAGVGVFSIVMSIPVALFVYRLMFQIDYFNNVHVVTIFLILGIGADNVFVFADAWKQSKHLWYVWRDIDSSEEAAELNIFQTGDEALEILIHRLSYTLQRASSSVLNTMLTTCVAFLATAISPVIPVAAFGVFAAVTVFINYLWIFLVQPSITIWNYSFGSKYCTREAKERFIRKLSKNLSFADEIEVKEEKTERELQEEIEAKEEESSKAYETLFFTKLYIPAMLKSVEIGGRTIKPLPIVTFIINIVIFLVFGIQALSLEVPSEIPGNYNDQHMFGSFRADNSKLFAGGGLTDFADISYVFGIETIDRDGFQKFDPNGYRGEVIYDPNFELAPSVNQQHYIAVCDGLRTLSCKENNKRLKGCTDTVTELMTFPSSVECILEDFYIWYNETVNSTVDLQILGDNDPSQFYEALENFSFTADYSRNLGFVNSELKYISIPFRATLLANQPTSLKEPVFQLMYDFEDSQESIAPVGLKTTFLTTFDMVFLDTEKGIIEGLFSGLSVSLPAAYAVLFYGTNNFYLATFAFLSIVGIVACVLGSIVFIGWQLGVAEAIAAIMVVGLSVDYCVHLGHMYTVAAEEGYESRVERFSIAAKRMGPTVLAGFVTTGGSSSFMFLCQLSFFNKMATLIFLTVFFSLEFALGFFLPANLLFGPEKHNGVIYGPESKLPCCKLYYQRKKNKKDAEVITTSL